MKKRKICKPNSNEIFDEPYSIGIRCIIPCCRNSLLIRSSGKNESLYRFPINQEMQLKWISKCKLSKVTKSARVCSDHFKESDFSGTDCNGKRLLKDDAIPSRKLALHKRQDLINKESNKPPVAKKKKVKSEIKSNTDFDEIIEIKINPINDVVANRPIKKITPRIPRKRKIYKSPSESSESDYDEGDIEVTGVPLEDGDDTTVNVAGNIILKRLSYQKERRNESFYEKILKQHNNCIPDKETLIKIIEDKINEHSKLIEDQKYMSIIGTRENNFLRLKDNITDLKEPGPQKESDPSSVAILDSDENPQTSAIKGHRQTHVEEIETNHSDANLSCPPLIATKVPSPKVNYSKPSSFEDETIVGYSLDAGNTSLRKQNVFLRTCNDEKDKKIKQLERELETKNVKLQKLTVELDRKTKQEEMLRIAISKVLTENQIKLITQRQKKVVWTPQEMLTAFTIRFLSKRCYNLLRDKLNYPLPGMSSVQRWATAMSKCSANEEGGVMYFPNATDDVIIEGTLDEINKTDKDANILRNYLENESIEDSDQEAQPKVIFIQPNDIANLQWELIGNIDSDNSKYNLVLADNDNPVILQGEDGELFLSNSLNDEENSNAIEVFNKQIIRDIDMGYQFINEASSDSTSSKQQPDHSYAVKIIDCSESNILQVNNENQ